MRISARIGAAAIAFLIVGATPAAARSTVAFSGHQAGTVVIKTQERRLYYVLSEKRAVRYAIAVGRPGMQWSGRTYIGGKHRRPAWSPPPEVKRDNPRLPNVIPGGAPNNPMGAAALTLGLSGEYAIHGTNRPGSIGRSISYGCFRMHNGDVLDLYGRVSVGTPVIVVR